MNINVRDFLGDNYCVEDAIILREILKSLQKTLPTSYYFDQ